MIEGAATSTTRGFGQMLDLDAEQFSFDPDYVDDKQVRLYLWNYCQSRLTKYYDYAGITS